MDGIKDTAEGVKVRGRCDLLVERVLRGWKTNVSTECVNQKRLERKRRGEVDGRTEVVPPSLD